jgi:hypothetical protein
MFYNTVVLTNRGFDIVLTIFDTITVVPFRSSFWKSSDPNFASGPFPSPLTTTFVRTQQRKVIRVLLLQVGSRGLPSSTVELRKSLRSCERRVLLVAQSETEFQSKLQSPHLGAIGNVGYASPTATVHATVRQIEVNVVENIEELELKLGLSSLRNGEILEHG